MAEKASSGRQLFFDLIAAAGESQARSSFESAAWAVAAEQPRAQTSEGAFHATLGPHGAPIPETAADRIDPGGMESPEPAEVVGLRLIDDEDQPPLVTVHSASIATEMSAPGPGPRISAFAAATGAAIAPLLPRSATRPPVQSPNVGKTAALSSPAPASAAPSDVESIDPAARPGVTEHPDPSGDVPGLPARVTSPLAPTSAAEAEELVKAIREAQSPRTAPRNTPATAGRMAGTATPPAATQPVEPGAPAGEPIRANGTQATSPSGGGVLLADDDDFGPLVLPEPTRRSRRGSRATSRPPEAGGRHRHPRRAGAAVGVLLLVLACIGAWWATARPSSITTTAPADVAMVDWRGIALPVSSSAGPTELTETRASGFARSPLGAAIAAAHLSVRVDPAAGPEVFEPVLAEQVVGARDRLAAAVRAQFDAGPADGAPGALLGWRLEGDPASSPVTTHLSVEHADGTRADYAIPLEWVGGDWRIDAPSSGPFFPMTDLSGTYEPFVEEATS